MKVAPKYGRPFKSHIYFVLFVREYMSWDGEIGVWNGGEWVWNGKGNEGDIEGDEEGEGGAWKGNGKAQGREGSGWIN